MLKDFDRDLNVIFAIQPAAGEELLPELVNITIMRKDPNEFIPDTPSGSSEELKVGRKSLFFTLPIY